MTESRESLQNRANILRGLIVNADDTAKGYRNMAKEAKRRKEEDRASRYNKAADEWADKAHNYSKELSEVQSQLRRL